MQKFTKSNAAAKPAAPAPPVEEEGTNPFIDEGEMVEAPAPPKAKAAAKAAPAPAPEPAPVVDAADDFGLSDEEFDAAMGAVGYAGPENADDPRTGFDFGQADWEAAPEADEPLNFQPIPNGVWCEADIISASVRTKPGKPRTGQLILEVVSPQEYAGVHVMDWLSPKFDEPAVLKRWRSLASACVTDWTEGPGGEVVPNANLWGNPPQIAPDLSNLKGFRVRFRSKLTEYEGDLWTKVDFNYYPPQDTLDTLLGEDEPAPAAAKPLPASKEGAARSRAQF